MSGNIIYQNFHYISIHHFNMDRALHIDHYPLKVLDSANKGSSLITLKVLHRYLRVWSKLVDKEKVKF